MATTVASLNAVLSLSSQAFERGMKKARRTSRRFGKSIRNVSRTVRRFGGRLAALAGVGGVAGIGFLIKRQIDLLDKLAKTSSKLGIQSDQLAGLRRAARLTGVEIRTFDMGLQRFARRLAEASIGTGEAQAALAELKIDAEALTRLPLQRQLFAIADAMNKVEDQSQRIRLGFKLFDSEGVALINTMALGGEGLREVIEETRRLGLTFSRLELRRVEALKDTFSDMAAAFSAATGRATIELIPALNGIARAMGGVGNVAKDLQGVVSWMGDIMRRELIGGLWLIDQFHGALLGVQSLLLKIVALNPLASGAASSELRALAERFDILRQGIGEGTQGFLARFMQSAMDTINDMGDDITRFLAGGITPPPDLGARSRAGTQLVGARALGITGNQPRFGGGVQGARFQQNVQSIRSSTANMEEKVASIHTILREQQARGNGAGLAVGA